MLSVLLVNAYETIIYFERVLETSIVHFAVDVTIIMKTIIKSPECFMSLDFISTDNKIPFSTFWIHYLFILL